LKITSSDPFYGLQRVFGTADLREKSFCSHAIGLLEKTPHLPYLIGSNALFGFLSAVCCPHQERFLFDRLHVLVQGAAAIAEHEDDGTEQCDPGIFDTMAPNIAIESRLQSDDRACAIKSRLKGNEQAWPSSRE
jgi:hypothetical protein